MSRSPYSFLYHFMKIGWTLFKYSAIFLSTLIASIAFYFLIAFVLLLFPVSKDIDQQLTGQDAVGMFIISNGVHTDLVFPIVSAQFDWRSVFSPADLPDITSRINDGDLNYLAIGWGDRNFYLNTPTWGDLTIANAWNAIRGGGESLLHVTYLRESQFPATTYALSLTDDQYQRLIEHVLSQLQWTLAASRDVDTDNAKSGRRVIHLAGSGYTRQDTFYQAHGSYNLITTCNTWTGRALASVDVKVSRWTPLPAFVTWYLPIQASGKSN